MAAGNFQISLRTVSSENNSESCCRFQNNIDNYLECEDLADSEQIPWWLRVSYPLHRDRVCVREEVVYFVSLTLVMQAAGNLTNLRQSLCCSCHDSSPWQPNCLSGVPPVVHPGSTSIAIWAAVSVRGFSRIESANI